MVENSISFLYRDLVGFIQRADEAVVVPQQMLLERTGNGHIYTHKMM